VVPDPTTNHLGSVDANGNTLGTVDPNQGTVIYSASYDVENRFMGTAAVGGMIPGNYQYSYAPGNKRVWRGDFGSSGTATILTTDEVTFWGVNGQKLGSYASAMVLNEGAPQSMFFALNVANYYFGGKLVGHYTAIGLSAVSSDRLGSVGKYYPYGQEKPSATTNGTEKFTGYFRDSETGFDYANNRYHNPGTGRFLTPDPYMPTANGVNDPTNPGSWNRYSYVGGDPITFNDPTGEFMAAPPPDSTWEPPPTVAVTSGASSFLSLESGGGDGQPGLAGKPPCGPNNPGGVTLTSAQTALLGGMSFSSLTPQQQIVFLTITADAAFLGVTFTGLTVSSITVAGAGAINTELNLTGTGASVSALNNLAGFTCLPNILVGRPHDGGDQNCRANGLSNSLQISGNTNTGEVQLDIDPFNPASSFPVGVFGHFFGQVLPNGIRGTDTNYTNVANALQGKRIQVFNCP
jgi:RHS repeat-associated protein